jgi:hypothetical protein
MRRVVAIAIALSALHSTAKANAQTPTWTEDIAPLMQDKCMNCHRPGEVAPMSLLTYNDARPWARSIQRMVEERIMPPWHADPQFGDFGNNRRMTQRQIDMITEWAAAGAPRGEGTWTPPD